ncbi:MAG: penicillin-binding protein 1A [Rhodospirillaceae bacterium]|nr:penicillin-binding protein 1A [Rhodospirillaceae bacterium]
MKSLGKTSVMAKAKRTPKTDDSEAGDAPPKKKGKGGAKTAVTVLGIFATLASGAVWAGLLATVALVYFAMDLPKIDETALTRRPHVQVLDANGAQIANFGDIYGDTLDLKKVPPFLPAAVVAVEDRRFYEHHGLDFRGLARAAFVDLKARRLVQGGSTITQQVAKNLFLTPDRTLTRKIREALLALKLERTFTKDQILALYMNRVYFGGGVYGFEAASEKFFGHPAKDVNVFQAAVLAGLLKAPSHYNPQREPEQAKTRAAVVLATMVETGALTDAQAKTALKNAAPVLKAVVPQTNIARYFADWVVSQVDSYVGAVDRDLVIRTTLDLKLQAATEKAIASHLDKSGEKLNVSEAAAVVMSPDGAVRAMVGGRDYADSQFNRATQALRQPGSAFKPFVFLTAVENGLKPDDMVTDAPIKIGRWKPRNYTNKYEGPVSVETALAKSLNTATVRIAQDVGAPAIVATAHRMGISSPLKPELSLALGTGEVTLLELTGAYAPFANGGAAVLPYTILDVSERGGQLLYQREGQGLGQVMTPEAVQTMNKMMVQVIARGTGTAAGFGFPAAGKTGTSSDYRDAWFMGFTTDYVTGVWVGNDSGAEMKAVTGGGLPAQIWHDVMASAHVGHEMRDLPGLAPPETDLIGKVLSVFTN